MRYSDVDNNDVEDTTNVSVDKLKLFSVPEHTRPLGVVGGYTWLRSSVLDKTNKTITTQTIHFSVFVLGTFKDVINLLYQNYPNPFNPLRDKYTRIEYSIERQETSDLPVCSVKIYNIAGELVRTLLDGKVLSGTKDYLDWNGRNDTGEFVSDGVYLCQLVTSANAYKKTIKILIIK
jgi:hypothetical protein